MAPLPRAPRPSEHTYRTTDPTGSITKPLTLPCWHDAYLASKSKAHAQGKCDYEVETPEVAISLVVPAYNEEERLGVMLEEACAFLKAEHSPRTSQATKQERSTPQPKKRRKAQDTSISTAPNGTASGTAQPSGWEILVVDDGSSDKTEDVAFAFSRKYPSHIRVVTLERNRGKGGAVTHGLRHVRGRYAVFADADGASTFSDVVKLVRAAEERKDGAGRAVAIGSRAHMVNTPSVVQRSALRNLLMHGFHFLLWIMTPRATSEIKDTQCGFKLFTRAALPFIVPHMHSEGWIFDVEMLMLAESAGIPMVEVPVGWKEVGGSKLNVVWDSVGMAWGLGVLRGAWGMGVYRV